MPLYELTASVVMPASEGTTIAAAKVATTIATAAASARREASEANHNTVATAHRAIGASVICSGEIGEIEAPKCLLPLQEQRAEEHRAGEEGQEVEAKVRDQAPLLVRVGDQ